MGVDIPDGPAAPGSGIGTYDPGTGWCIDPTLLLPMTPFTPIARPTHTMPSPVSAPSEFAPSYANVARLPAKSGFNGYPAPRQNSGPAVSRVPVFRLDMRQPVPVDLFMGDVAELEQARQTADVNRGLLLNNWLLRPRIPGESGFSTAATFVSPHLRSPAFSVSGSERSSRSSRRENPYRHRCPNFGCGEGFNTASDLR